MKQYSRIFQYLGAYKGKILLYFLFTLLSILFSIVSIGMLMPFLQLIFTGESVFKSTNNPILNWLKDFFKDASTKPLQTLTYICILMTAFIILKNFFLYLSYYILNPLKNKIVNHLR